MKADRALAVACGLVAAVGVCYVAYLLSIGLHLR